MCKKFLRLDAHAEYSTGDGVPRPTPERAVWDVGCNAQLQRAVWDVGCNAQLQRAVWDVGCNAQLQRAVWDVGCNESLQIDTGGEFGMSVITGMTVMSVTVGWLTRPLSVVPVVAGGDE